MVATLAQGLLEALPEAAAVVTVRGVPVEWNRRFAAVLGRGGAGPPALPDRVADPAALLRFLRSASRSRDITAGALAFHDGVRFRCEAALTQPRSEGRDALLFLRLLPHELSVKRFLELTQRVEHLRAEVERRRRIEDELRQQRSWLEVTLQSIGDAVIATDAEGRTVFMNPVAEKLTGWPQADAEGRPLADVFRVVDEETRTTVASPVERVLREGVVVGLANHSVLVTRDGREVSIDDSAAPIRDGRGRIRGVVLVFHDVTEQRALARQLGARARELLEADRRKNEFLAMLAHELRNPLAPMTNALELLRLGGDPERTDWARRVIDRQLRHTTRLVDDLLDVARIDRGRLQLRLEPVELALVTAHAAEDAAAYLASRQHRLDLRLPSEPLVLQADPVRIGQVVTNLLHNAGKFTPPGGRIELTLRRDGEAAELVVRDSGPGIEPDALSTIFEIFVQGDSSLAREQGGLGIGLAMVREVVRLHGGSARAANAAGGAGAVFTVRLPLAAPGHGVAAAPRETTRGAPARMRILVVEDNPDAADSLALLLEANGYRARVARSGPEALEEARAFAPDAALLDIGLPGWDGYEVARRLRREYGSGLLLIALTGYGTAQDRARAEAAGFDAHLVKPVDLRRLFERLAQRANERTGAADP